MRSPRSVNAPEGSVMATSGLAAGLAANGQPDLGSGNRFAAVVIDPARDPNAAGRSRKRLAYFGLNR